MLANAIRFAESGSTIRVIVQTQRDSVTLSVENHGDTIAAAQQARIFDRFYRVDASRHDGSAKWQRPHNAAPSPTAAHGAGMPFMPSNS